MWLWGTAEIEEPEESFRWGTDIEGFIKFLQGHNSTHSFHNLKFDGHFLVDWLLKHDYLHVQADAPDRGQFTTVISDMNKFYAMTIKWRNGHMTEFRDSTKKFPNMTVAAVATTFKMDINKGEIDYHAQRPLGYVPTEQEIDYLYRDVAIMARSLKMTLDEGMTRLTIASDSLAEYKATIGAQNFRKTFPVLSDEMDAEIRRAYRGGFTYADPRFQGRRVGCGLVLDVNSLYPSVMYNEIIPYGMPEWEDGLPEITDARPLTIFSVTFTATLKKDHIPCIQIKGSALFGSTEYLRVIEDPVTLMVTNVDWELYQNQYDIKVLAYGGGWKFKATRGLFDAYIDKWTAIKESSTGGLRLIAKLHLNSLYGKLASNPNVTGKIPLLEDGRVVFKRGMDERKPPVYTAAGVFITSYARDLTIRAAQDNYAVFAYADTDSLHLVGQPIPADADPLNLNEYVGTINGLDIHPSRMGSWKMEYAFEEAYFIRAKAYLEKMKDGSYHAAWAGMPDSEQRKLTFADLIDGNVIHGKLQPESVPGGVILKNVPYTIKL